MRGGQARGSKFIPTNAAQRPTPPLCASAFIRHSPFVIRHFATALVALALNSSAAQFKIGAHNLTVPDGFEVELVAAAPLVDRPISIAYDEQGRLYATDSAGMTDKAPKQLETKPHRIVRLEDTDGDGKFDKSIVFADRMMFPEGAMWYEGSLYVAAPPEIWKLTDTNGDGIADQREAWLDAKTLTGCANDLHGPFLGRDGWFYWAKGAFAEQTYERPGRKPFVTRAAHLFRARPDGTGIEPVMTGGMDNPVDIAITSTGERIFSTTFFQQPGGGKRDGLVHAIYGGVYGKVHDVIFSHPMTGDLMPVLVHMGAAAPCGLITYDSRVFGDDFRDNLFACYFNLHKVSRHILIPDGATFKTKDSDFIVSDNTDFHPTDVLEDADGSLLVVDTGGWYKICCPTSQLAKPDVLGGIYRIRKTGMARPADPRGLKIPWTKSSPAALAKLLADPRLYVQQRAIHELGKKGTPAVPTLNDLVLKGASTDARLNAVWALCRVNDKAAREIIRTALNDKDAAVRHAAIHSAAVWRDASAVGRLQTFLEGSDQALARAAAEALGRIGEQSAVPALLAAADRLRGQVNDPLRVLEHSLIFALIEIGDPAAVFEAASRTSRTQPCDSDEPVAARTAAIRSRAALVALDQIGGDALKPDMVLPLLNSKDATLKQTALWIVSHRPDWGEPLARRFYGDLLMDSYPRPDADEFQARLAQLAKSPAIQELLGTSVLDPELKLPARLIALRAMASAGLKETPARWLTAIPQLLTSSNPDLVRQAVATARTLTLPKQGVPRLTTALQDVGRDAAMPADVRLDALAASGSVANVTPELFAFLQSNLDPGKPVLTRAAAATVLARAKLTPEQQLALAGAMKNVSPLEAPKLLPAFERGANEQLGLRLMAALTDSTGLRGLRVDLLKPLFAKYPKPVQDASKELLNLLNADAAKQRAHLEALLPEMAIGDVRRGQALFNSQKAACATCHSIGYQGGKFGPDLTRIGQVRTEMDFLESIVYPSASFVRSYEPFTVVTKSGDDFTGIIRKDAPDEVILITGPDLEQRIARADIKELRPGTVSLMPDGLEQVLTKQELADLIAFLKNTKW
ncbi:MAG: PVC-type heme-binding CxxCH protein [Verrucomicrobiota bacterium]